MITRKRENKQTRKQARFNAMSPRRKGAKKNFYCSPLRLRVLAPLRSVSSCFPVSLFFLCVPCVLRFIGVLGTGSAVNFLPFAHFPTFPLSGFLHFHCSLLPHRCPRCRKVCGRFLNARRRSATIGDGRKFRSHRR